LFCRNQKRRREWHHPSRLRNEAFKLAIVLFLIIAMRSPAIAARQADGVSLFRQHKYAAAAGRLAEALKHRPDSPELNFYLGRSLLASNHSERALVYLKKAAGLDPGNADYRFWEGLGYWAIMDFKGERRCYLKALQLNRNHLSANLYLGDNYFDQGDWQKALVQYDRVLRLDPGYPDALFYRAAVLEKQDRTRAAHRAWRHFLDRYRSGIWAFHAVERLNQNGDFSYRECWLGPVKTILPGISFASGGDRINGQSKAALKIVEAALARRPSLSLHIVVYSQGHVRLARSRANALKRYLLKSNPAIRSSRLKPSWFGVPERVVTGGKTHVLKESVRFITVTH
jgi:tetratricopeptide (TPR) repeat protein